MQITPAIAELLKFNIAFLVRTLEGVLIEKYYVRPENRGNPIIWLLGHLVLNRGEIVEMLGGDPATRDLANQYARGTKPDCDPSANPEPGKLMKRYIRLASVTDHLLKNSDPAILDQPSWGQFESLGQNLIYSYMHETHHIGQITYVVNLPSVRGARKQTSFSRPDEKKNSTTKIVLESIKSVFGQ
jgi:hypothetical protein